MALLGGALRIHPQSQAFARLLAPGPEGLQLVDGVKDDVVGVLQELLKLVLPVGPAEHVDLPLGHLLLDQPGLIEAAGLGARQIRRQQGIEVEVRERLLRQQDLAAGALLHPQQKFTVAAQLGFVQQIAGGGQGRQGGLGEVRQPGKGRARVPQPHQSTRAGAWLSERGRPYLSRASKYGSGSNSSTVWTPLVVHLPVSSMRAPHMAGTPVV